MFTCWESADFLALLCVMLSCVFVTCRYGVHNQVWYLIVLIHDLCGLLYFENSSKTGQIRFMVLYIPKCDVYCISRRQYQSFLDILLGDVSVAQLVASMSGVVLGGVVMVVGSNLARGKLFTASIGSVDSLDLL